MELFVFALFASLAVLSALVVVLHRNPVYSVMSLVVTLVSIAVLFVLLGAPFLAALQVLVYTGAILVLFLFVLMLLNVGTDEPDEMLSMQAIVAFFSAVSLAALLAIGAWRRYGGTSENPLSEADVALRPLARELFSTYLLPFELVGLLLLVAVIAATVLARKEERPQDEHSP